MLHCNTELHTHQDIHQNEQLLSAEPELADKIKPETRTDSEDQKLTTSLLLRFSCHREASPGWSVAGVPRPAEISKIEQMSRVPTCLFTTRGCAHSCLAIKCLQVLRICPQGMERMRLSEIISYNSVRAPLCCPVPAPSSARCCTVPSCRGYQISSHQCSPYDIKPSCHRVPSWKIYTIFQVELTWDSLTPILTSATMTRASAAECRIFTQKETVFTYYSQTTNGSTGT